MFVPFVIVQVNINVLKVKNINIQKIWDLNIKNNFNLEKQKTLNSLDLMITTLCQKEIIVNQNQNTGKDIKLNN